MLIELAWSEVSLAAEAGVHRRLRHMIKHTGDTYGYKDEDGWDIDIEACGAEMAVAKYLGVYWHDSGLPDSSDVGGFVGVRWTKHPKGHLLVYDRDSDQLAYALVTGRCPNLSILGWMWGHEAKEERFWKTDCREACFWVPCVDLRRPETLKTCQ